MVSFTRLAAMGLPPFFPVHILILWFAAWDAAFQTGGRARRRQTCRFCPAPTVVLYFYPHKLSNFRTGRTSGHMQFYYSIKTAAGKACAAKKFTVRSKTPRLRRFSRAFSALFLRGLPDLTALKHLYAARFSLKPRLISPIITTVCKPRRPQGPRNIGGEAGRHPARKR